MKIAQQNIAFKVQGRVEITHHACVTAENVRPDFRSTSVLRKIGTIYANKHADDMRLLCFVLI